MKSLSRIFFACYLLLLIKFVVFKDIDMILIGHMRFYFGGTQTGDPNWIPFKTIFGYFTGRKGLLISGLNLAGNLALLFPLGFVMQESFHYLGRKHIFFIAFIASMLIETTQALFKIGIFDVDDVLLNGMGLLLGYFVYTTMPRIIRMPSLILFILLVLVGYAYYVTHSVPFNNPF
ncbi:VanZ family protein [Aquirufa regiilacus]